MWWTTDQRTADLLKIWMKAITGFDLTRPVKKFDIFEMAAMPFPCNGHLFYLSLYKHWIYLQFSTGKNKKNILSYFPPLFRLTKHSPSLQKASCSNPRPYFSNCMQNVITSVRQWLKSFPQKTVYYYLYVTHNLIDLKHIRTCDVCTWNTSTAAKQEHLRHWIECGRRYQGVRSR